MGEVRHSLIVISLGLAWGNLFAAPATAGTVAAAPTTAKKRAASATEAQFAAASLAPAETAPGPAAAAESPGVHPFACPGEAASIMRGLNAKEIGEERDKWLAGLGESAESAP